MSSAAQLDPEPAEESASAPLRNAAASSEPFALKQQVAERLAAHRARRGHASTADTPPAPLVTDRLRPARGRSAAIAAAVAERYAESPTYRSVLAQESARALEQAEAAAEVASINARAIARAQQQLLTDLGDWDGPREPVNSIAISAPMPPAQPAAVAAAILAQQKAASRAILMPEPPPARLPDAQLDTPAYTVRLYEDAGRPAPTAPVAYSISITAAPDEQETMLLDEEIAFRHDPTFYETLAPQALPANLLEFPRQLVAARKARPRLAEGPLREESASDPAQLRIFEVEAEHIAVAPSVGADETEWSSILLPAQPATTFFEPLNTDYVPTLVPQAAPLARRILSAAVDLCLITAGVVASAAVFVLSVERISHTAVAVALPVAGAALLGSLLVFAVAYHQLFFLLSDATPGMRYARIALCTLTDDNPSRSAMRGRLLAMLVSLLPLGLGYLWAMLDEDGLGWHDRMSRMYQRSY